VASPWIVVEAYPSSYAAASVLPLLLKRAPSRRPGARARARAARMSASDDAEAVATALAAEEEAVRQRVREVRLQRLLADQARRKVELTKEGHAIRAEIARLRKDLLGVSPGRREAGAR
jgi:hypothetical protein